jgi:hypothetical protein
VKRNEDSGKGTAWWFEQIQNFPAVLKSLYQMTDFLHSIPVFEYAVIALEKPMQNFL